MLHMLSADILALGEKFTERASVANRWAGGNFSASSREAKTLAGNYARLVEYLNVSGHGPDS
jgi:hypothetical protein